MSRYYRHNPEAEINHDWFAGAAGYSSSDMDKLQAQEPLDTDPTEEGKISVHLSEIFGEELDE